MAFQQQDLDKLDRAKLSPQLFYLDNDVQALLKALNFFDMDFISDEPVPSSDTNAGKLALFGGGKVHYCSLCLYVCMYRTRLTFI